jgi:hypothetical protein
LYVGAIADHLHMAGDDGVEAGQLRFLFGHGPLGPGGHRSLEAIS